MATLRQSVSKAFATFRDSWFDRTSVTPTKPQGVSGTGYFGGFVSTRERNPSLIGQQKYTTLDELVRNQATVAASVRYILEMTSHASWAFDPIDDTDEAKKYAEKTEEMLTRSLVTPWHRIVRRAATYRFYGFSLQEWIGKRSKEGLFVLHDIQARPQRTIIRWDVRETGELRGVGQESIHDGLERYLPRGKLMYLVDDALDDSPEGLGLLRQIAEPARRLMRYEQLEGFDYETTLKGMPIGRVPLSRLRDAVKAGTMTPEEMEARIFPIKNVVENHIRTANLGAVLDSITWMGQGENAQPSNIYQYDLDVVKGEVTANAQKAIGEAIIRLQWDIARICGTESLLIGANGRGTHALSADKTTSLLMMVDGMLQDIAAVVHADIVLPFFRMNGWPEDLAPRPQTDAVQYRNISEITKALLDMAQAGAVLDPDDPAIAIVRRAVGLPRPPEVNRAAEAAIQAAEAAAATTQGKAKTPGSQGRGSALKMIREEDGKFLVLTNDGSRVLGTHDTRAEAERQLRAVEVNKAYRGDGHAVVMYLPAKHASEMWQWAAKEEDRVQPEDMHLTLAFLGESLTPEQEERVKRAVEEVSAMTVSPTLVVGGLDSFSPSASSKNRRVWYAPVEGAQVIRAALVERIGDLIASERAFVPHVTLAYQSEGEECDVRWTSPRAVTFEYLCYGTGGVRTEYPFKEA